jgi:hypothetical protein
MEKRRVCSSCLSGHKLIENASTNDEKVPACIDLIKTGMVVIENKKGRVDTITWV